MIESKQVNKQKNKKKKEKNIYNVHLPRLPSTLLVIEASLTRLYSTYSCLSTSCSKDPTFPTSSPPAVCRSGVAFYRNPILSSTLALAFYDYVLFTETYIEASM